MWQFSEVIDGLTVACNALGTPITGGNVSFYNETLGKSIYPTPVIGILGVLDDASNVLKIAFREEGDLVVLLDGAHASSVAGAQHVAPHLGNQPSAVLAREFSSSEYSRTIAGIVAGEPPAIDLAAEKRLIDCLVALATDGILQSAHDISDGGLAVTLAESCFSLAGAGLALHGCGVTIKLNDEAPPEFVLFGERGARAIASVRPSFLARLLESARQYGVAAHAIGQVTRGQGFRIELKGRAVIDSPLETLRDAWANSLERSLKVS
jgi:phosphoribosylformylglycinamidine (FGAM) synthase-like enzyme